MADAKRDQNFVPTMLGVSSVDSVTPVPLQVNPVTGRLLTDVAGGGGYTNLTQFVAQTPWRVFYSDGSGDVQELALGADGTYLKSNGASAAPSFATPGGAGTVTATGGSLTANAVVLGAGTTDTKVSTGITTDGVSVLNLGVNATTLGKLKLFGNTSGDVTLQPNAIAGTGVVLTLPATTGTVALTSNITGTNSNTNTGDQTITNSSDGTSHTVTLSASGGSVQLVEGSNITLTTTGTSSAGIVTIASTAGGGNVSKVGTPADNQIGVWTGDGTIEGDAGLTFDGGLNVTVADAENKVGLTINQNDVTNIPASIELNRVAASGYSLVLNQTNDGQFGSFIKLKHISSSPQSNDAQGIDFYFNSSTGNERAFSSFSSLVIDATDGAEYGGSYFNTRRNGTSRTMLRIGCKNSTTELNGLSVGDSIASAIIQSAGNQDLILQTGNATTGNITIVDGANGDVQVNPNGTGTLYVGTSINLGHATDTTISRVSAGVVAVEGVTVPTVSSTNTLTNKRVTKRVGSTTSSATPTINTDDVDIYKLTAQTVDITSFTTNLSGTPTDGQTLIIQITGTAARAITWGASFEASTVALPTTTVSTNRLDCGFIWNTATSKWRCIAAA